MNTSKLAHFNLHTQLYPKVPLRRGKLSLDMTFNRLTCSETGGPADLQRAAP